MDPETVPARLTVSSPPNIHSAQSATFRKYLASNNQSASSLLSLLFSQTPSGTLLFSLRFFTQEHNHLYALGKESVSRVDGLNGCSVAFWCPDASLGSSSWHLQRQSELLRSLLATSSSEAQAAEMTRFLYLYSSKLQESKKSGSSLVPHLARLGNYLSTASL